MASVIYYAARSRVTYRAKTQAGTRQVGEFYAKRRHLIRVYERITHLVDVKMCTKEARICTTNKQVVAYEQDFSAQYSAIACGAALHDQEHFLPHVQSFARCAGIARCTHTLRDTSISAHLYFPPALLRQPMKQSCKH